MGERRAWEGMRAARVRKGMCAGPALLPHTHTHTPDPPTHPSPTRSYDPSKFAHIDRLPDRDMEAAYDQIQAEERRALRIARTEDARCAGARGG